MRIGSIGSDRHLVTFENPGIATPDPDGGYTEAWTPTTPATWYVSIRPASARDLERTTAGTVTATATHIVHGRYHPQVTTKTRMLFEGRIFHVNGVANLEERDREMQLFCEEQL
jgi:SPP1 family predicted phage head-tail adaptor